MTAPHRALAGQGLPAQFVRFGFVGVAATVTHYLVATVLAAVFTPYAANLGGYLAAVGLSYHGHTRLTFRVSRDAGRLPRFVAVSLSALGLSELVLYLGLATLGLPHALALLLAVLTVPPVTFVAARWWVFRDR